MADGTNDPLVRVDAVEDDGGPGTQPQAEHGSAAVAPGLEPASRDEAVSGDIARRSPAHPADE